MKVDEYPIRDFLGFYMQPTVVAIAERIERDLLEAYSKLSTPVIEPKTITKEENL